MTAADAALRWNYRLGGWRQKCAHRFFYSLAQEAVEKDGHDEYYVKHLARETEEDGPSPEEISSLTGNLFGAGSDTSSSTLITFMLACCAFPAALPRVQADLDAVVGPARSPSLDDARRLPYVSAFVKEVLRCRDHWRAAARARRGRLL